MTDLRELEKRLEEATGCNQELDAALWSLWDKRPLEGPADGLRIYKRDPEDCGAFDLPPNYTASLDAAVALVERVLPGWCWLISRNDDGNYWVELAPNGAPGGGPDCEKATPALALCLALIRALIAKE